jgi:hypothetical protein
MCGREVELLPTTMERAAEGAFAFGSEEEGREPACGLLGTPVQLGLLRERLV